MTIKIVSANGVSLVTLKSLEQGSAFRHEGVVYVKTDEGDSEQKCMSVDSSPGYLDWFSEEELVEPVTLEIAVIVGGGQ